MQQLTYACSDGIPGRASGGWGVLYRSPSLEPLVEQHLVELVSVDLPATLPSFPGRQQLLDRPVRFRVFPEPEGTGVLLARSIEAGLDHTRRPGNVFTHAARVDRQEGRRALDFQDAPEWLVPFGADQVRRASPPDALTCPDGVAVLTALTRSVESDQHLSTSTTWVVDALTHLLLAGRSVCLVESVSGRAALWFRLASWALDERSASLLGIAVHEDRRSAVDVLDRGYRLLSVPDDVVAGVVADRAVVLDPRWTLDEAQAASAGSWTLPNGLAIPYLGLGRLLQVLLQGDPVVSVQTFALRESIVQAVRGLHASSGAEAQSNALWIAALAGPAGPSLGGTPELATRLEALPNLVVNTNPVLRQLADWAGVRPSQAAAPAAPPRVNLSGRRPAAPAADDRPVHPFARPEGEPAFGLTEEPPLSSPSQPAAPAAPAGPPDRPESLPPAGPGAPEWASPVPATDTAPPPGAWPARRLAPDPLDAFSYPTPRSATIAVAFLARQGMAEDVLAGGWVDRYVSADALTRVALLHAAAHACEPRTEPQLALVLAATQGDAEFERLAAALLVEVCRSQLVHPPHSLQSGQAWDLLALHVGQCDAVDLAHLAFHVGPVLGRLESGVDTLSWHLSQLVGRPTFSAWGFATGQGRASLAEIVWAEIKRNQAEDIVAGPSGGRSTPGVRDPREESRWPFGS